MFQIIYIGSAFCALLTIYLLLFKKNALRSFADYILSLYFLIEIWSVVVFLLMIFDYIDVLPYVYKTAAPLNFLLPPLSYIYVRVILYNKKATVKDLWHLILFLIVFINYLPFYILPITEKTQIISDTLKDLSLSYKYKAGFLSEPFLQIAKIVQLLIYLFFQWRLIISYKKENAISKVEGQIKIVLQWLRIFTLMITVNVFAFLILFFFVAIKHPLDNSVAIQLPVIVLSISFFILSSYILIHPVILEGLPFIKYKKIESQLLENKIDELPFIEVDYSSQIESIKNYFTQDQPYLNKDLNLSMAAVALKMNNRELSFIINNYFNMRFTDFVNSYRIEHIINKVNANQLKSFTIESMAMEVGFNTKSNFYKSFQKLYHTTPKEYFEALQVSKKG